MNALVDKLNEKSSNRTVKDIRIGELHTIIHKLRDDAAKSEVLSLERQDDIQKLKKKLESIQSDRKFLYVHARDEKQKSLNLKKIVEELKDEISILKEKLS